MMDRRRFLRAAGIASASALASCVFAPASASPSPTQEGTPAPASPAATPTARAADWDSLGRALKGELVRPADPAYDAARILYNTRFDSIRPQGVARCVSVDDVRTCVAFAAQTGVPLALRSGGHSYGGWSTGTGLVVDTGPISRIEAPAQGRVTVGAGAKLIDVYAALAPAGAGLPGGSCATVGITGLALGGGVGVLSRSWGLTSDDLLAAEVVTADGRIVECDAQREPDLFWALRGGGGSFGAVTSLTFRTHPAGPLALGFLSWPWSAANPVIAAWQSWQREAPATVWSNLHLDADPAGARLSLYAVGTDGISSLRAELDRLDAASGLRASRGTQVSSFMDVMLLDAGCAGRTASQCHLRGQTPEGVLERETFAAKSIVASEALSAGAIDLLVTGLANPPVGTSASVIYDALGGAVSNVAMDATAFPHRRALGVLQFVVGWSDPAREADAVAWLRSYHGAVRAKDGTAAYANYADPDLADWPGAYYGTNYARLQRIKRAYDPKELFTFPQAIRPG